MEIRETSLAGLVILTPRVFDDARGHFYEAFKRTDFEEYGLPREFVQDNMSSSKKGVIRGLHFQIKPHEQGKLVRCLRGAIFDVVVDLRPDSKTFGKWESLDISEKNKIGLYVPPGFAHGFQALEDNTLVLYKCTSPWDQKSEGGIRFDDAKLAIRWPLKDIIVSEKDLKLGQLP